VTPAQPSAAPEASAAPPAGAAWQPPSLATYPYPDSIEDWRPLIQQLLAEAWDEGRLDGPAARIDDDLVLALIRQESQGDPNAESWVGAIGLMQVMPFTFADVMAGDRSLTCAIDPAAMWDVPSNVRAGLRYLALAMNAHEGNLYWALASYNAGIDTVHDWRTAGLYAVPPAGGYWETADYAQRILRDYLSRRPDVAPLIHVPDPMPQAHVPGALRLLQDLDTQRGAPRPKEWIPRCTPR
jgi:soluble lytic murein transglycosylase-like protein